MLAKRRQRVYATDRELVFDLTDILNRSSRGLWPPDAISLQIDEPVWVGYPQVHGLARLNHSTGLWRASARKSHCIPATELQLKKLFKGQYDELFPAILDNAHRSDKHGIRRVRRAGLDLFSRYPSDREIVVGVIDVRETNRSKPRDVVAARIRRRSKHVRAEKL